MAPRNSFIPAPVRHSYRFLRHYGLLKSLHNARPYLRELLFGAERHAERSEEFDRRFGTDTSGATWPWELASLKQSGREVHGYETVPAQALREALGTLPLDQNRFTFIDLGSGKGRALLVASEFPFSKIVGVELAVELHQIAHRNTQIYRPASQLCRNFDLHCGDAAQFDFPVEPLVLFLYSPFGKKTLSQVIRNLQVRVSRSPFQVFVLYVNPQYEALLRAANFLRKVPSPAWYSLYESSAGEPA